MASRQNRRLIVAITGASGATYGVALLRELRAAPGWESHLVLSDAGALTCWHELRMRRKDVERLAAALRTEPESEAAVEPTAAAA